MMYCPKNWGSLKTNFYNNKKPIELQLFKMNMIFQNLVITFYALNSIRKVKWHYLQNNNPKLSLILKLEYFIVYGKISIRSSLL